MADRKKRGSEKLLAAWKTRALTEESFKEIATGLSDTPGTIEGATVHGGNDPSGVSVSLMYDGDDVPWCGNDIIFWLRWHRQHGGTVRPPRIIINGTPYPDLVRVRLDFGNVAPDVQRIDVPGSLTGGAGLG